jgi:hypothetical protein
MSFDICLAFDKAEYLNPQIYIFADSIKDKLPEDTVVHIVTNRPIGDESLGYLTDSIPVKNHIVYYNEEYPDLESRCRYMLNTFKIHPTNPWVIKMELDFLFLKHLSAFEELLDTNMDLILEPENRKIFSDSEADRLWRIMYRTMGIKLPDTKIRFRENNEEGLALFGTGLICVRSELLPIINKRWEHLTWQVEPWGPWNVHPNEVAFGAMIFDEEWNWKIYPPKWKYNPIAFHRDGPFPSTKLKENSIIPDDTVILDYHHLEWLNHMAKYNKSVSDQLGSGINLTSGTCKSTGGF